MIVTEHASQPVKVVSSMGEQSVGKSYALNHFLDTSFAGSAMRCTEGAWLSLTPTDDALIVALDFEGTSSVEVVDILIIKRLQGFIPLSEVLKKICC